MRLMTPFAEPVTIMTFPSPHDLTCNVSVWFDKFGEQHHVGRVAAVHALHVKQLLCLDD